MGDSAEQRALRGRLRREWIGHQVVLEEDLRERRKNLMSCTVEGSEGKGTWGEKSGSRKSEN
jgi:hypothetical protein